MTRVGVDLESVQALDMVQRDEPAGVGAPGWPVQKFQPLPTPNGVPPFRATSAELGIPAAAGPRVLHVIGDTGGVMDPDPQKMVVAAMAADVAAHPEVGFAWHVGDIGYFNGEQIAYTTQFFEAYHSYLRTIVGIPGNHDGDPLPGVQVKSLAEYMAVFCSPKPVLLSGTEEYGRDTQCQPNCYWTLLDPAVTIVGLYSNVPSGGVIEADQAAWLEEELKAAPTGIPLIVSLHHPPLSCDAHHGGSAKMGALLDAAFKAAGRWPDMVLSGHVHNYQRFTRTVAGKTILYVVCGASGYHHRHTMAAGAKPGLQVTSDTTLDAFCDSQWGFLRLTVNGAKIAGEYVGVAKDGTVTPNVDRF